MKNLVRQDATKLASDFGGAKGPKKLVCDGFCPLDWVTHAPRSGDGHFWVRLSGCSQERLTRQTRRQYGPKERQQKDCDLYKAFTPCSCQQILHRDGLIRRNPAIERRFSTEQLLQRDPLHKHRSAFKQTPFTQSPFYTETHLHRDALNKYLLYRDPCTRRPFYTETRFHRDPFKQTPFYAESLSHRDLFTRKPFYVQMRLHTQQLLHSGPSMQRPFYTE
jgi:hypothetical protein